MVAVSKLCSVTASLVSPGEGPDTLRHWMTVWMTEGHPWTSTFLLILVAVLSSVLPIEYDYLVYFFSQRYYVHSNVPTSLNLWISSSCVHHDSFGILTLLCVGHHFFMLLGDALQRGCQHLLASWNPECSQVSEVFLNQLCVLALLVRHSQPPVLRRLLLAQLASAYRPSGHELLPAPRLRLRRGNDPNYRSVSQEGRLLRYCSGDVSRSLTLA